MKETRYIIKFFPLLSVYAKIHTYKIGIVRILPLHNFHQHKILKPKETKKIFQTHFKKQVCVVVHL